MIIQFKKKYFSSKSPTYLLDHYKAVLIISLLLIVASFLFIDKSFALFATSLSPTVKELFSSLSKLFSPLFWVLMSSLLFFVTRFVLKREKKSRKFWYFSLMFPLVLLGCKLLQLIVGRASPEWFILHQEAPFRLFEWNPLFHSFPSALSCNIMAFGSALSCLFQKRSLYYLIGAFALSFMPALAGDVFISDSLAGICLGALLAQWIFKMVKREVHLI
jgi:hypothetical protein